MQRTIAYSLLTALSIYLVWALLLATTAASLTTSNIGQGEHAMTREAMEAVIRRVAQNVQGKPGVLQFEYAGVTIACISDTAHDRMRLIAPVARSRTLTAEQTQKILDANFHTALDARYATSDGLVYAAFIHPLSPLSERELESALQQVANLTKTFGTTYTSGVLDYGTLGAVNSL